MQTAAIRRVAPADRTKEALDIIVEAVLQAAAQVADVDLHTVDGDAAGHVAQALASPLLRLIQLRQSLLMRRPPQSGRRPRNARHAGREADSRNIPDDPLDLTIRSIYRPEHYVSAVGFAWVYVRRLLASGRVGARRSTGAAEISAAECPVSPVELVPPASGNHGVL